MPRPRLWILVSGAAVLLLLGGNLSSFFVDLLWFRSEGFSEVFWTAFLSRIAVGAAAFAAAYACLATNLHIARIRSPEWGYNPFAGTEISPFLIRHLARRYGWIVPPLLALLLAAEMSSSWLLVQAFRHQAPTGIVDPVFHKDVSFYLFSYPVLVKIKGWLMGLFLLTAMATAATYLFTGGLVVDRRLARAPRIHVSILLFAILLLLGWGYWLARFQLLYSSRGAAFGASYTDLHAQLPAYNILIAVAAAIAVLLAVSAARRSQRLFVAGAAVFLAAAFLGTVVYPQLVQKFNVEPNELQKELPYIAHTIEFTRRAYDLEDIDERPFPADEVLDRDILAANDATIQNVRLWDWRPLLATYRQLQEIRPYYSFHDVDVDRYTLDGRYRQVMLSARELAYDRIPVSARTWVNIHLKYTHGYGLCLSPVNRVTPEGLPEFFIQDIPPQSRGGVAIERPAIYFGELTTEYCLVKTGTEEFDYPMGDANQFTTYQADAGIPVGSLFSRLLFAWHLRSSKILLTEYLRPESRILIHRTLSERIPKIAPFLVCDEDPFLVVHEGRLFWMQDAYTTSRMYPYSQPYGGGLNYIRNSVKVVVDAYTGDCTFYVFEPDDPLIRTYQKIFPGLFRPGDEMPQGLRRHVRYPEDLFKVQARIFATFHMTDPQVFYNREDLWDIPRETLAGEEVAVEPYYIIMKLPGQETEEMILMLPFSPGTKDNMIAWLAARCDGEAYGQRIVHLFPKHKLIYGPRQIEARIDQDPAISQVLTLWSQRGSQVQRGNLLVIPIEGSLLYVEPLYLQAEKAELPELKRVIIAAGGGIRMAPTLEEALELRFGAAGPEAAASGEMIPFEEGGGDTAAQALRIYRAGLDALRRGDWAAYGGSQEELEALLLRMAGSGEGGAEPDEGSP